MSEEQRKKIEQIKQKLNVIENEIAICKRILKGEMS